MLLRSLETYLLLIVVSLGAVDVTISNLDGYTRGVASAGEELVQEMCEIHHEILANPSIKHLSNLPSLSAWR